MKLQKQKRAQGQETRVVRRENVLGGVKRRLISRDKIFHLKKKDLLLVTSLIKIIKLNKNGGTHWGANFMKGYFLFSISYLYSFLWAICCLVQQKNKMEWGENCCA